MKKIKYIIFFMLGTLFLISCTEVDNEVSKIEDGMNLAVFEATSQSSTQIADGLEWPIVVRVKIQGPALEKVSGDLTVTIGANEASTAVEGTHFRFDETTLVLREDNNYLGLFEFTMLTEGIETPIEVAPVIALEVQDVSGNANIKPSGKFNNITLNYACPSDLAGVYSVVILRDGAEIFPYSTDVTIVQTDVGTYRTDKVGHWDDLGVGTPGFTFTDVCNVINVPQQDLVDYYGNQVQSTKPGRVIKGDPLVLEIEYSISSSGWSSVYTNTYTRISD